MKSPALCVILLTIAGCAQTMKISDEKLGSTKAALTIDASELKGYVAIPLINSKVVNVYLSEFPECIDGEPKAVRSQNLGKATLTPKENIQTVPIPSGKKLLISSNSQENAGGNVTTCWNSVHFTPEEGHQYILKMTPHKSFGKAKCSTSLLELVNGDPAPVESAIYPKVEYKGFWQGDQFNHCAHD
ncbi:hypothetical protein [Zhongshania sp. BJYM1]|uniref:hypothetical protein n=1 Tax=Zhongshania aquatica TaxID=2965069 RepID=UPI0022B3918B|nr:hypothetical protein [Marortus sp. BJYM1]